TGVYLIEGIKHPVAFLSWDPHPCVANRNLNGRALSWCHQYTTYSAQIFSRKQDLINADRHVTPARGELDGVFAKVIQHLPQAIPIRVQRGDPSCSFCQQLHPTL